jgi:putative MATE family efflux protein
MSENVQIAENKMGTMPVNRLIINMALPMVFSMLVQALYNIVDSIFVARINEDALTAVSLAFPIQNLMFALAIGTAVGMNAYLSRSLGEKNYKAVSDVARNGIFLSLAGSILFLLLCLAFNRMYFAAQTDVAAIAEYGYTYLTICTTFSFGAFGQVLFERMLQSTGKTAISTISQVAGAALNIALDPIMIFGYFGFPAMGIAGAATATVISQIAAMLLAIYLNLRYNKEVNLSLRRFRPQKEVILKIYSVGVPSMILISIGSVMIFGLNRILITFSSTAVAVFGVFFRLQSFIFMPVFGLNNCLVPIIAYNYGARNKERIISAIKVSLLYSLLLMTAGFILFQVAPRGLLLLFDASPDMLTIGVPAIRIISVCFIFAGFCIIASTVFQALGRGAESAICAVVRQLGALLPAAYLLSLSGNLNLVWLAYPIAEIFSLLMSALFLRRCYIRIIKPMPGAAERQTV